MSAPIADGPPRRLLEAISEGRAELVLVDAVRDELARVLREKLNTPPEEILALLDELAPTAVPAPGHAEAVSGDQDDDRIIDAALSGGADVLVSGDRRHVLPLGRVRDMRVLRPQDALAELDPT